MCSRIVLLKEERTVEGVSGKKIRQFCLRFFSQNRFLHGVWNLNSRYGVSFCHEKRFGNFKVWLWKKYDSPLFFKFNSQVGKKSTFQYQVPVKEY